MVTLQILPIGDQLPRTVQDLFIVVVMALLGMGWFLLKARQVERDAIRTTAHLAERHTELLASQERLAANQERTALVLENHLGAIGQHMAVSNETLRLISTRLLDEAFKVR